MDRFAFARSRKIRPRRTLRHPTEKRKKADTRVNVSTWCERIAAPMLLEMPHKHSARINFGIKFLQHLYNTQCTQSKFFSQDREESAEEFCRPAEFREEQDNHLANNQQSVKYCPKSAGRLIRDSAPTVKTTQG